MEDIFSKLVNKLILGGKTISSMESCTGGCFVNNITSIPGASEILKFSAVTYSNEFKIKMGVNSDIIDRYSVYSMETAVEMSTNISRFTGSSYGVGITGKFNKSDPNNLYGNDDIIYVSIYDKENDKYYNHKLNADSSLSRCENKEKVSLYIAERLIEIIK